LPQSGRKFTYAIVLKSGATSDIDLTVFNLFNVFLLDLC